LSLASDGYENLPTHDVGSDHYLQGAPDYWDQRSFWLKKLLPWPQ